jgi:hypothetical protein
MAVANVWTPCPAAAGNGRAGRFLAGHLTGRYPAKLEERWEGREIGEAHPTPLPLQRCLR